MFDHDYSELKDSFEKSFCCKCGEQPGAPGVCPKPSDQALLESCTLPNESDRKVKMKIKLSINCVVTTNQIQNEKFEYILCTSYLSPEDFHSVYIEKKVEETGLLHCINSWGPENKPTKSFWLGTTQTSSTESRWQSFRKKNQISRKPF